MEEESEIFDCNLLISNKQNITHELTADYSENFEAKEVKEIKPEPSKKI